MADRLPQLLGVLALAATDRFRAASDGPLGRGGAHSAALVHLDAYPGASIQALAAVLGVSHPAAVKIADRLAADGLVERRTGTDQRVRALHLTDAGRRAAAGVLSDRAAALGDLLSVLDPAERDALEPLLERLVAGLAEDRPGALTVCRLCDRESCCGGATGCPLQHTVR
jgi:MarR family transcriptional regulator, negative regulator of the multidrug operon emrRAB